MASWHETKCMDFINCSTILEEHRVLLLYTCPCFWVYEVYPGCSTEGVIIIFLNLGAEMIRHIMNYSVDRELICQIFDNIKSVTLVSTLNGDVEVRWHTLEFTSASEELFSPAIKLSNENKNRIVWWSLVYVSLNKISLRFLGRRSDKTSTLRPAPPGILNLWHSDFIFDPLMKLRQTFQ